MITLLDFLTRLGKIFQKPDLDPGSLVFFGPTNREELEKYTINKCIVSTDFNNNAIMTFLEQKAEVMLLFYPWDSNRITDILYKKFRILRDKKICMVEIPKHFFSIPFGIHERIGSYLGLKMINLFHHEDYKSARIFEPLNKNFTLQHLLDLIHEKLNMNYIRYVNPEPPGDGNIKKILIHLESEPSPNLIIKCFRQKIDTILCTSLNFLTARNAIDYSINMCDLSFNWLNIVLEQFVSRDLEIEIPEIIFEFVPPKQILNIFIGS
jgi:hypothetical protein